MWGGEEGRWYVEREGREVVGWCVGRWGGGVGWCVGRDRSHLLFGYFNSSLNLRQISPWRRNAGGQRGEERRGDDWGRGHEAA